MGSGKANNRSRAFEVTTANGLHAFPYAKCTPEPTPADPIGDVYVDPELANEGFTYILASGVEGSVLLDEVLDYNRDPAYLRDLLLYQLTVEAHKGLAASRLSKREIIRRLGTSPAQFYRLLDTANYRKSIDAVLELLLVLERDVELVVRDRAVVV